MAKLTLSVDERLIARAKEFADRHGTSVSRLVASFLEALGDTDEESPAPVLGRLRGSIRKTDLADYGRYLEEKYR